jgi:restriction endonuclease S subunit
VKNTPGFRIADLCELVRGKYPTLKTPPGPYPLVVTANFRRSAESYQIDGAAVCVPLISSTGHGDAALHRVHYQEGKFAVANLLVALIPKDPTLCYAKYLYHYLMTKKDELLVPLMLGTANVSLKEKDIARVVVPVPPMSEQRRIVAGIEKFGRKIDEARALCLSAETELAKMLLGAFNRISHSGPRERMEDIAPIIRRPVDVDPLASYPELGIRSFGKGTFHKPALSGLEVGTKRMYRIEPGDLLFSNVFAWEGGITVVKREDSGRFGSHRFIACVPKPGIATSDFLCFYFLTAEGLEKIGEASPGGAGRNRTLGLDALSQIEVPVPSFDKQKWFTSVLHETDKLRCMQTATMVELDAVLPSILDRAFNGEL